MPSPCEGPCVVGQARRPALSLPRGSSLQRRLRVSEDIEERIALRVDLQASVRGEGRTQGTAVLGQRFDVALLAEFLDQARRALDVGEEECDGPGRER